MLAFLLYRFLCRLLSLFVPVGVDDRDLEIAVLRHQLSILSRPGKRPRYSTADRAFLAAASRFLPRERWSAFPVAPDTLTRWRRQLVSRKRSRRRRAPGRPRIDPGVRDLIVRMARENPRWGYLRIKGELLKLGITVSCGVKKLVGHSDLAVRKPADPASDCPDAVVHPVPASVLAAPRARPLRPG